MVNVATITVVRDTKQEAVMENQEIVTGKASTGLVIDASLLQDLSDWAAEERRSRNSLMDMILSRAVEQRKAVRQVAEGLQRGPLPAAAFPNADADLRVA